MNAHEQVEFDKMVDTLRWYALPGPVKDLELATYGWCRAEDALRYTTPEYLLKRALVLLNPSTVSTTTLNEATRLIKLALEKR